MLVGSSSLHEQWSVHAAPAYAEVLAAMKARYQERRSHYKVPDGLPK